LASKKIKQSFGIPDCALDFLASTFLFMAMLSVVASVVQ
jgi:hypothetical protein